VKSPVLADLVWELEERDFDSWVARSLPRSVTAVYTFEHAALATLGVAKRQGQYSFLEVPAQHSEFYRRIHDRQLERYPELRNSVTAIQEGSRSRRRMRRKMAELAAANCILCNSSFTKRTLIEARVASDKIEVTPYGFPPPAEAPVSQDGPVIFLNAGTQDLRKGIHLLYQAWRRLNLDPSQGELWLIGKMQLPESLRADLPGVVRCMNSIPHTELLSTYRRASVFVLPSLADGFGLVATEAMSQGLPVIITTSTGAADVIEHGRNGFVIPSDDVDALEAQMRWCIEHRQQLTGIGGRALDTARSWQWSDYRDSLARTIQQRLDAASDLLHRQRSVPAFDGVN
jgi:glycosyltransferase involved in cell wall biosynthesis